MSEDRASHWQEVYSTKAADSVSWFQPEPAPSLEAIVRTGLGPEAALVDVGGGASSLVDQLLAKGWRDLAVLDIAGAALEVAKARLGGQAHQVDWIVQNAAQWRPARQYDIWHDRAVFHFLTDPNDREGYKQALAAGLKPGGHLIMATFAPDGPERCSGLVVQRYDAQSLSAELGPEFTLAETWREVHATPWGSEQVFNWCRFTRAD